MFGKKEQITSPGANAQNKGGYFPLGRGKISLLQQGLDNAI
jgi:hypothetical protein